MNFPLASLVRWRVIEAAKHSARLRHALRQAAKARPMRGTIHPPMVRLRMARALGVRMAAQPRWTIGPRGVLP